MDHYIITVRKTTSNNRVRLSKKDAKKPDPNFILKYCNWTVPAKESDADKGAVFVKPFKTLTEQKALVARIVGEIKAMPAGKRDVLFTIHGYDPRHAHMNLFLLWNINTKYVKNPKSSVGKVIFFSWPDKGAYGNECYEAHKIGWNMYGMYRNFFALLSKELGKNNSKFYLLTQSFGHRVWSGFMAKMTQKYMNDNKHMLATAVMMAADAPHRSIEDGKGVYKSGHKGTIPFRLDKVGKIAKKVHVFYDKIDLVLWSAGKQLRKIGHHPRLGVHGAPKAHDGWKAPPNFSFWNAALFDLHKVIIAGKEPAPGDGEKLHKHRLDKNVIHRHRYFYTSQKIVDKVIALLKA